MKRISFLTTFSVIALFSLVLYMASCKPDPCKTRAVECNNGGTCKDGECICAAGYEGDSCQFKVNKKFDSFYACIRSRTVNNSTIPDDNDDTLHVKALDDKFAIQFFSVRDSTYEVLHATVNGNYITIPDQTNTYFGESYEYNGTGSLNNGVLTITLFETWIGHPWTAKTTYVGYKY